MRLLRRNPTTQRDCHIHAPLPRLPRPSFPLALPSLPLIPAPVRGLTNARIGIALDISTRLRRDYKRETERRGRRVGGRGGNEEDGEVEEEKEEKQKDYELMVMEKDEEVGERESGRNVRGRNVVMRRRLRRELGTLEWGKHGQEQEFIFVNKGREKRDEL